MTDTKKLTSINLSLLWFGASISIAEILTGTILAPLGMFYGTLAIIIGHIIGCVIFYLTGYIGAESKLSAIESTRISFGKYGSVFFSVLNIIQLIGWTAVMIINAAKALNIVTPFLENQTFWSIIIGLLISVWILIGVKNLTKINILAVSLLFIFCIILAYTIFKNNIITHNINNSISFGLAVELSVTMPLSWLPLISDYTKDSINKKTGALSSAIFYSIGSIFMYIIGLGASIYANTNDIAVILIKSGFSFVALLIVILSTVTTTFLDAWSGGVSVVNINKKINVKVAAIIVCIIGTMLAIFININEYENFLYFIGSVFAPLFAILITDYFILKIRITKYKLNIKNLIIWAIGFVLYRILLNTDFILGATLPVMATLSIICILANKIYRTK